MKFAKCLTFFLESVGQGSGTFLQADDTRPLVVQTKDLLQKCKVIARNAKVVRPSRRLFHPEFNLEPPPRVEADAMVQLYFRYFESTYRILHVPTFWIDYNRFWDNSGSAPMGLRFEVLLSVAIGSSQFMHGDGEVEFRSKVHQWIYAAQMWLSGPLEKDRLNITGIRVHCLTLLARQIFSIGGDLVWTSIGSLIHRAMHMGLHRDPRYLPAMSVLQAEIRRRLWATILEMAVQSSLGSEMPARISFDEFDTEPPSNVNDEEIQEPTSVLQPHPKGEYTATSIQLVLLGSLRTRLRVVQLLNGLSFDISYAEVLALSSDLIGACKAGSTLANDSSNPAITPFHRNMLDYLTRRFLLHLHCPFACEAYTNPLFYYSRKVSLDAAMAIVSPEPDDGFSRLRVIGGGLFRDGIRFAGVVISLELIAQTEAQRLDGTLNRSSESRELLKQAVERMIALSAERIQHGESNVKNHMFLSTVVAEAKSIEEGTSREFKIAESARNSLRYCHDLLEAQLGSGALSSYFDMDVGIDINGEQGDWGFDFDMGTFLHDAGFT